YRELASGSSAPTAQERARQALYDDPRRHVLRRSRDEEGKPVEPRYGFSGRARELLQLERWLMQGKLVVIHGFGGVGKTALVRETADWLTRTKMYERARFVSFEHGGDATGLLSRLGNFLSVADGNYNPNVPNVA